MKKIFLVLATTFTIVSYINAQQVYTDAFTGSDDIKYQVGANFQKNGTGIMTSLDYGLGESFSIGLQAGYLLGAKQLAGMDKPGVGNRFNLQARASAHLGDVIGLPENFDIYPGLNLGLKNFGGHVGARTFFKRGFGVFAEAQFPIARYKKDASNYDLLNNQFNFSAGASFDLTSRRARY